MCGFLGTSFSENNQEFLDLLNLGKLRGPDSTRIWENNNIRLGFNRLAIQDLSENGNQPMLNKIGSWVIVFNGEIYNHIEIRQGLDDYEFQSSSDTETILASLEKFGFDETIKSLNGMFAIAAYNILESKVYLARDLAGIKPLYYGIKEGSIIFASQFNQLFQHSRFRTSLQIRQEIMKEYFALGYMQAPNTIYQNIFQLEPGQFLIWDLLENKIAQKEYFYNWIDNPTFIENSEQLPVVFNSIFGNVVKDQMISDVPIASFLSGGIDSPLVAAHAKEVKPNIRAFTIGVDDETLDESNYAVIYAEQLKIDHLVENFSENELLNVVNAHFDSLPEPHGDYSSIPTYLICKKAKRYATVMLSGDGGDELFWGYPRFNRTIDHIKYFKIPGILRKGLFYIFRKFGLNISYGIGSHMNLGEWLLNKQIHLNSVDDLFPNCNFSRELLDLYNFDSNSKQETLLFLRKNEFYGHMQRVLRKVDLMSMANSLEVRVPFLDKSIIKFSQRIKPLLGIKHNINKLILKKALSKFIPENLLMKEKRGFTVPVEKWLKGPLKQDLLDCVVNCELYGGEYIETVILKKTVTDFLAGKKISPWGVWHIYSWQKWALSNGLIKN